MSLLRQASGLPESNEELKHEGVTDMFKSKNIETTLRTLILMSHLERDDFKNNEYDYIYITESVYDGDEKPTTNSVDKSIAVLKNYLNGNKSSKIVDKKYTNEKLKITSDGTKRLYELLGHKTEIKETFKKYFERWTGKTYRIINHNEDYGLSKNVITKLEELMVLMEKVIESISKENKYTDDEVTKETAINQDWLDTQTAIANYLVTAESLTSESASNFVSNIKTFFTNSLLGINNAISNFMKSYTITDKYFKDNISLLNNKNSIINTIMSKKFYEIESIETKCVVGMKLNYVGTTKELKVFATKIPEIKTSIDKVSSFIENIYNNHNDARLSNISLLDGISVLSQKTTNIISELIDGKSVKEDVTIGNLFPNSNAIKIVKEDLVEINNLLLKTDVEDLNKSVQRLINVLNIFLKEINDNESVYSKNVIQTLQYTVKDIADVITNFGTFLVLSNQFTSFYLTTLDVVNDAIKPK